MAMIEFSKKEKEIIVHKIKLYFQGELDQEIGQFDAEFLLDFFLKKLGPITTTEACMMLGLF